jgi:hypothetical protein
MVSQLLESATPSPSAVSGLPGEATCDFGLKKTGERPNYKQSVPQRIGPRSFPCKNVMSATQCPSLHRFTPRCALETTSYGYEVLAPAGNVSDCVKTVRWIDCWCPDAAQFILIEASSDFSLQSCSGLLAVIDDSHLAPKLRLVCNAPALFDQGLIDAFNCRGIGLLAADPNVADLERLADRGIVGVRLNGSPLTASNTPAVGRVPFRMGELLKAARNLGLRSIASQVSGGAELSRLFAGGFDYVSVSGHGIAPSDADSLVLHRGAA